MDEEQVWAAYGALAPAGRLVYARTMERAARCDWDAAVARVVHDWSMSYWNNPSLAATKAEFVRCFNVNVPGNFHRVGTCFSLFVGKKEDCIVNISSWGASRPRQGLVWYNSSKGAVFNVRTLDSATWLRR